MSLQQQFEKYIASQEKVDFTQLEALWDALPAVDQNFMLGQWSGGVFNTGHPGEKQLGALKWVGKNFHSFNDVDPIVCATEEGGRIASPVLGKASCRMVGYRNAVTATMVYDNHPIFDHFKMVDENRVLGVMDKKGDDFPLYFYLNRV